MPKFDPCLCIVFNHPFPQNIPILERVYRPRFPKLKFLIPFYVENGNDDVITVYRGSFHHQGYATDAAHKLADVECSHFIFLQDDVLLNPSLNAENLDAVLEISPEGGFINNLSTLNCDIGGWHWLPGIVWKFYYPRNMLSGSGVDSLDTILRYLPPADVARKRMEKHGVGMPTVTRDLYSLEDGSLVRDIPYFATQDPYLIRTMNKVVVESLFATAPDKNLVVFPYPLALTAWGADFFVVPKSRFPIYQHYAGILAAACTFAEVAVGTALVLAVDEISTAKDKILGFDWVWGQDRSTPATASMLATRFSDPRMIAVHPIKWSQLTQDRQALREVLPDVDMSGL